VSRDTQFEGFAKRLMGEMVDLHGYIDISGFFNRPDDETVQEYTQIITRRAHDLVQHAVSETTGSADISHVPDMPTWPEEAN
jgi:hypothetical protein